MKVMLEVEVVVNKVGVVMVKVMVVVVEKNRRDGDEKGVVKMVLVTLLKILDTSPESLLEWSPEWSPEMLPEKKRLTPSQPWWLAYG